MFNLSSIGPHFSPHFIVYVSLLFPLLQGPSHSFRLSQSILFIFVLFGCIRVAWSFNRIVSFAFWRVPSWGLAACGFLWMGFGSLVGIHCLGLGSGGFAAPWGWAPVVLLVLVCLCWAGCGGGGLLGFVLK